MAKQGNTNPVDRADALTAEQIAALSEDDYEGLLQEVQAQHEVVDHAYNWLYTAREYHRLATERAARLTTKQTESRGNNDK